MLLRPFSIAVVALAPWVIRLCAASIITDGGAVKDSYDFIVVGAGTAGNVIGNRLSESGRFSVLIIEAGGSDLDVPAVQVPLSWASLFPDLAWNWNYTTTPQSELGGRIVQHPRGRMLGLFPSPSTPTAVNHFWVSQEGPLRSTQC